MKKYNVAVAGATGAVGEQMIKMLEKRNFPVGDIRYLASSRSAGKKLKFLDREVEVEELTKDSFSGIDIALFSAGGSRSEEFAPAAAASGAIVIDNSSAFRMDKDVPLVVPEVNPDDLKNCPKGIIANPNCSTIQMVVALAPIQKASKIKRIVVTTFQSVSGAGARAIEECWLQTKNIINDEPLTPPAKFAHQIAFNALPHIDSFLDNGYTKEEIKMVNETKKIFNDDSIQVTATCVRVPVLRGHSESVNIETEQEITVEQARELLSNAEGVILQDDVKNNIYPLAVNAADKYETFVGRIRKDYSKDNCLNLWVVSDNLLKGAALNAVQIAEKMIEMNLI